MRTSTRRNDTGTEWSQWIFLISCLVVVIALITGFFVSAIGLIAELKNSEFLSANLWVPIFFASVVLFFTSSEDAGLHGVSVLLVLGSLAAGLVHSVIELTSEFSGWNFWGVSAILGTIVCFSLFRWSEKEEKDTFGNHFTID